jgi:hypothetical protein
MKEYFRMFLGQLDVFIFEVLVFTRALNQYLAPVLFGALPSNVSHPFEPIEHARQSGFLELRLLRKLVDRDPFFLPKREHDPALGGANLNIAVFEHSLEYSAGDLTYLGHQEAGLSLLSHCLGHQLQFEFKRPFLTVSPCKSGR